MMKVNKGKEGDQWVKESVDAGTKNAQICLVSLNFLLSVAKVVLTIFMVGIRILILKPVLFAVGKS